MSIVVLSSRVKFAALILAGLLGSVLFAESGVEEDKPGQEIRLEFAPKTGESFRFVIKKGKTDSRQSASAKIYSETGVIIKVLHHEKQGSVLEWKFEPSRLYGIESAPEAEKQKAELVARMLRGLRIEYSTTPEGQYEELRNIAEVRTFMKKAVEEIVGMLAHSPEQGDKMRAALMRLFASDAAISGLVKEPPLFHSFLGESLDPDFEYDYEMQIENPFGQGGVPAKGKVSIEPPDAKGIIVGTYQYAISPEHGRKLLKDMMSAVFRSMEERSEKAREDFMKEFEKMPPIKIAFEGKFHYSTALRRHVFVSMTKTVDVHTTRKVEWIELREAAR